MNGKPSDNKKQTPGGSGAASFQPSLPPQEIEEECAVCLEPLPVDSCSFVRLTCCGKGLHKECDAGIDKSTMSHKQKNTCIMCRAKHPPPKGTVKRLRAWVKKGKAWAQTTLASGYCRGDYGLPQSYLMAVKLYGMAVKQGDPNAMNGLGVMYEKGQGVDQSYEKANELFKLAADRGHAGAQCKLGLSYFIGQGVDQSYKLAREWLTKAAAEGKEDAIEGLKILDVRERRTTSTTKPTTTLHCNTCHTSQTPNHKLNRCKCHTVWYCNGKCQREDWLAHRTEHRRICEEQGLSREEGEAKDAVEDDDEDKKETGTTTTTPSTSFTAAALLLPQEEEDCPVCLEALPVDVGSTIRMTCCGKAMHKTCDKSVDASTMSDEQKSICIFCRATHPKTDKKNM